MAGHLAARLHVASGWLFVGLWALVVLDLALDSLAVRRVAEAALAALMLLALLKASVHIRVLASLLLAGTAVLTVRAGDWDVVERGLRATLAIGAFLPVVALVRVTVLASPTVPAIRERVGEMTRPERRAWMTGGAYMLGAILTLGFVSVLRPLLPADIAREEREALAACGTRGLALAVGWSPFFVASAVAAQLVPSVPAWSIVGVGLGLSALGGAVAHLMFNRGLGLRSLRRALSRLAPIVAPTLLLVGAVILASAATGWNALQSVIAVVPALCAAYLLGFARPQAARAIPQVAQASGRMGDELLILAAATVFGVAVAGLAISDEVGPWLGAIGDTPWLVIVLSVVTITTLGIAGLHPMVSAAVIVPSCIALGLPIAHAVLAQIVVFSWSLSSTVSAWTLPVVVSSSAFEVPVRRLVFGPNLRFVLAYGAVGCTALALLDRVLRG